MVTYNHEEFLVQAIEGVLMQEVAFNVELIIADDCSTDNTQKIVNYYQQNHPKGHWIKYFRHPQNKGMIANFTWTLDECKGNYIAICEGDDYWTDSSKLQKQVDFLENNSDFVLVSHKVKILKEDKLINDFVTEKYFKCNIASRFEVFLFGNFNHTCSLLFRNVQLDFKVFESLSIVDYILQLELSKIGMFYKLPEEMAVYRYGVGVFTGNKPEIFRGMFKSSIDKYNIRQKYSFYSLLLGLRVHHNVVHKVKTFEQFKNGSLVTKSFYYLSPLQLAKAIVKVLLKYSK